MFKNQIEDIKINDGKHHGFYRGVVEDIDDPLSSGRVRIRVWGLHSQSSVKNATDGIPTSELPWAEPCIPIAEGGISQRGFFGVPQINSHVLVIFENGNPLRPIYIGSLPSGNGDWNTGSSDAGKAVILNTPAGYIKFDSTDGSTEVEIKHNSGSNILLKDNGDIELSGENEANITVSGNTTISVDGEVDLTATGEVKVTGSTVTVTGSTVTVTGNVSVSGTLGAAGITSTGGSDITAGSITLKTHVHSNPEGGTTGPAQ
jgi:phage baseplate assembly protein gpV